MKNLNKPKNIGKKNQGKNKQKKANTIIERKRCLTS